MQLSDAQLALLESILNEWNRAEEDIKRAEQVCNNIVIPSIKELRYAGRRIVDALLKMKAGSSDADSLLQEARFDCHRARHDAIDAATAKMAIDLDIMVKKIGYEVILPVFPKFPNLICDLNEIREKIVASRRDRDDREKIYSVLEVVNFPALVAVHKELLGSEPIMKKMATRRRWLDLSGIAGTIFGIIGVILAIYSFYR